MFPVRYELNFYIVFRRSSVFKRLIDGRHGVSFGGICFRHKVFSDFLKNADFGIFSQICKLIQPLVRRTGRFKTENPKAANTHDPKAIHL
jgi:hypothetical protein